MRPSNALHAVRIATVLLLTLTAACGSGTAPSPAPQATGEDPPATESQPAITFIRDIDPILSRSFGGDVTRQTDAEGFSGGMAAADYDGDGDVDLYFVGGNTEPNHLYRDQGDGTYVEVAASVGLDLVQWGSGPAFGDIDGDGDLDLFIGAVNGDPISLFENRIADEGIFVDITATSGLALSASNTFGATFFDYDYDGHQDLFLTHWDNPHEPGKDTETVWRNRGDGTFTSTSIESGIAATLVEDAEDSTFTPNFTDLDGDGFADLLMSSDFGESQVYRNNGDGTFTHITDRDAIRDQNGMGGAIGDFDNDGDFDWFVTSIYDLDVGGFLFGNRLYRNDSGAFVDITDDSMLADGAWGWGACAADVNNDTRLDIIHVNGWTLAFNKDYRGTAVRYFQNVSGNVFFEQAETVGLTDDGQGRGIACFDAQRDGDIDIVISNNDDDNVVYYRNETESSNHFLNIRLRGAGGNRLGIGSLITVTTDEVTQVREMGGRNHYISHGPYEVHFGLGSATRVDISVRWPDGTTTDMQSIDADQHLVIVQPGAP